MKLLMASLFTMLFGGLALAQTSNVMFYRDVVLPVNISTARVVKTNHGYGNTYLVKVLVPELAAETLMNHRNDGEGAPCMATYEASDINQVIQNNPAMEQVGFRIMLTKTLQPDPSQNSCHVTLNETITAKIRGFTFLHSRSSQLPDRVLADCR